MDYDTGIISERTDDPAFLGWRKVRDMSSPEIMMGRLLKSNEEFGGMLMGYPLVLQNFQIESKDIMDFSLFDLDDEEEI